MDPFLELAPASRKEKKLVDQIRDVMRVKHYSLRTEQSYCDWVKRFIRFDPFALAHMHSNESLSVGDGRVLSALPLIDRRPTFLRLIRR